MRLQHDPRFALELCKIIPFLDLFCSLFAGQWWLAVGNMAEQVESAEGVAIFDLVAQSIQRDAQRLQLFDDHLLLLRLAPAPEKFVQRFVVFLQRLFRVGTSSEEHTSELHS